VLRDAKGDDLAGIDPPWNIVNYPDLRRAQHLGVRRLWRAPAQDVLGSQEW